MVTVTFIESSGRRTALDVPSGMTVMEAAITHEVPGIVGFCGGMCACGTCHCYPDEPWRARLAAPEQAEMDTLEGVPEREPFSRLGCQIEVTEQLEGMMVRLPSRQRIP